MSKEISIHVPPAHGRAFEAKAGQYVTVINLQGKQVGDLIAFNAGDMEEKLGANPTFVHLMRFVLKMGDQVVTNRRNPMLEIVRDDYGKHDLLIAACDPYRYEIYFDAKGHRNCSDNLLEAMRPWGLKRHELPQPINLFQNMRYGEDGSLEFCECSAKQGDRIVFRALMDIVGALSACAMDLTPAFQAAKLSDLEIRVSDAI